MNKDEAAEIMSHSIPREDAYIILEIVNKTIEIAKLTRVKSDEELEALPKEVRDIELITQRLGSYNLGDDVNCIFIRFVEDETPLAESLFYPILAVWSFLDTARGNAANFQPPLPKEEIEKFAFDNAVEMFLIMLRNLIPRMMLSLKSITDETINEWYRQRQEHFEFFYSKEGIEMPRPQITAQKIRAELIGDYGKDVSKVWSNEQKRFQNWQKWRFAEEYEKIYLHWKMLNKICRDIPNWHDYAKTANFTDTPDDLLEKLENTSPERLSELALEHSARRTNNIKTHNVEKKDLEKRRQGILASGYSSTHLFNFLNEGKQIAAQMKTTISLEQNETTAQ